MANECQCIEKEPGHKQKKGQTNVGKISDYLPEPPLANVIATFFLVAVGIWGIVETKKALKLSERAWVSIIGVTVTKQPESKQPIRFAITLVNNGRQPAADGNIRILNSTIDGYAPELTDMRNIQVPINTACANLAPEKGRTVITPGTQTILGQSYIMDTVHGDPPFYADDAIMSGAKFYVLRGCIAYVTFEEVHTSAFCYILVSTPLGDRRNFSFATCYRGFDAN